jgi:16S rRNA (guanine527-N7)-methyltransferase
VKPSGHVTVGSLGRRYGLPAGAESRLQALLEMVTTDPTAPTTVTQPAAIVRDHLADSLAALELESVRNAAAVADLGSGSGFPGLPLAIALPRSRMWLVESNGRKCDFIVHAAEASGVTNAQVIRARAEAWSEGMESCDLVVARALAPLAVVAEYAAPLLRLGGTLVVWRGRRDRDDEESGARAAAELGLQAAPPVRVEPYPGALYRHLHAMLKVADTPDRFPRRAGMARKRPLGT